MSTSEKNRRGALRKRPRGWVRLECRGKNGMGPNIAHAIWDISQTGVCLVTKALVQAGEVLELRLTSSSHQGNFSARGTVVWVDPLDANQFTVGVRFGQAISYAELSQLTV